MIALDAPVIAMTGNLFANGGGGGEGATLMKDGRPGEDAPAPMIPAAGGADTSPNGGNGGDGGAGAGLDGQIAENAGVCDRGPVGGGGGGGGAGVIRAFPTQALGGLVSPPPS